jgi:hypothetical protein
MSRPTCRPASATASTTPKATGVVEADDARQPWVSRCDQFRPRRCGPRPGPAHTPADFDTGTLMPRNSRCGEESAEALLTRGRVDVSADEGRPDVLRG